MGKGRLFAAFPAVEHDNIGWFHLPGHCVWTFCGKLTGSCVVAKTFQLKNTMNNFCKTGANRSLDLQPVPAVSALLGVFNFLVLERHAALHSVLDVCRCVHLPKKPSTWTPGAFLCRNRRFDPRPSRIGVLCFLKFDELVQCPQRG